MLIRALFILYYEIIGHGPSVQRWHSDYGDGTMATGRSCSHLKSYVVVARGKRGKGLGGGRQRVGEMRTSLIVSTIKIKKDIKHAIREHKGGFLC